jgi:hypothetical protein
MGVLASSHIILNKLKNYYSLVLNVQSVSDIRQIEIYRSIYMQLSC